MYSISLTCFCLSPTLTPEHDRRNRFPLSSCRKDRWRGNGPAKSVPGFQTGEQPIEWSADGKSLYAYRTGELPAKVYQLDLATGKRTLWRALSPADPAGVGQIAPIVMSPDGSACIYGYHRTLSDLSLVEGLK